MAIQIPLSIAGSPEAFALAVQAHRDALEAHLMGSPGKSAPVASSAIEAVIERRPQSGPVAKRGPDEFVILPYEIIDDTPRTAEQQQAIDTLRATIG
jgi:hypothetical protein